MKKCFTYPNKRRYTTQKDADTAILLLDNKGLRTYYCQGCDGWHLTSKSQN